jgi:hypothetical protein
MKMASLLFIPFELLFGHTCLWTYGSIGLVSSFSPFFYFCFFASFSIRFRFRLSIYRILFWFTTPYAGISFKFSSLINALISACSTFPFRSNEISSIFSFSCRIMLMISYWYASTCNSKHFALQIGHLHLLGFTLCIIFAMFSNEKH